MTVVGDNLGFLNGQYQDIIKDELNVKEVKIDNNLAAYAAKTVYLYTPRSARRWAKIWGR